MKKLAGILMLVAMTVGFASAEGFGEDGISKGAHYPASNCEIFMDKISAQFGSHAYKGFNIWVKTLNSRLDSDIVQVGFRYKLAGNGGYDHTLTNTDWLEMALTPFMGSRDYYKLSLNVSSDFFQGSYTGAFYVRTANGTNYWLKTANGGDFVFDVNGYNNVSNAMGGMTHYSSDINVAVPTQRSDMYYYNPGMCR